MEETVNIRELLTGSSVYDDVRGMGEVQLVINKEITYVSYTYDGNSFIDMWFCMNGEIELDNCTEPDVRYSHEDPEYYLIQYLIDMIA